MHRLKAIFYCKCFYICAVDRWSQLTLAYHCSCKGYYDNWLHLSAPISSIYYTHTHNNVCVRNTTHYTIVERMKLGWSGEGICIGISFGRN